MTRATGNVVVISADNTVLHVGDADDILGHLGVQAAELSTIRTQLPEIYDDAGHQLNIEDLDGSVELTVADAPPRTVDEQHLIDRISLSLAMTQVQVNEDPNNDDPTFRVPVIVGSLPVVLAGLAVDFGEINDDNTNGGRLHRKSRHPHF